MPLPPGCLLCCHVYPLRFACCNAKQPVAEKTTVQAFADHMVVGSRNLAFNCSRLKRCTMLTGLVKQLCALQALRAGAEHCKWRLKQSSYLRPTELAAGVRQATVFDELCKQPSPVGPRRLGSACLLAPIEAGGNRGPKVPGDQTLKRLDCAKAYARDTGLQYLHQRKVRIPTAWSMLFDTMRLFQRLEGIQRKLTLLRQGKRGLHADALRQRRARVVSVNALKIAARV